MINTDHYAEAMAKYVKDIKSLSAVDTRLAFNGLLYIGPHAHGDRRTLLDFGLAEAG
jgi:hypothetical protein